MGRKHPAPILTIQPSRDTVGYIRLPVREKYSSGSIENQKLIFEEWGYRHQVPIMHYYIDNGFSGNHFDRPAFQQMIQDVLDEKIECIVVKDLSRLGRAHIAVGYHLEILFPRKRVRFVSVNDQFDTIDGMTNQNKEIPIQLSVRIPLINLFNERISIETKIKMKELLDMKAQHGEFIGPRAPFGYQKSTSNRNQLVPDPIAAITVRKIFELAANGMGVTAIVRYLNEKEILTPIQYARSNGLTGNYDDGDGSWNSRSVKYILTNRTYTGMLIQGKEKRAVMGTHEALVDEDTFESIQKSFQARAFNIAPKGQSTENILKEKVVCGCCGGKMQRKRGTGHADWHFFTCITKNRLGTGRCTGMYVREEDVFNAIYRQLKDYVNEHYITDLYNKQQIQKFNYQISEITQSSEKAWANAMQYYEQYVRGEASKEDLRSALDAAHAAKTMLAKATEQKATYDKEYSIFRKLLSVGDKRIPLSEVMDCIEKIIVDAGKKIVVKWSQPQIEFAGSTNRNLG